MKKYQWLLIGLVIIVGVVSSTLIIPSIQADSGWDSSYDSGGSDWSGSSGSDWSSSSGSNWSGSSSSGVASEYIEPVLSLYFMILGVCLIPIFSFHSIFKSYASIRFKNKLKAVFITLLICALMGGIGLILFAIDDLVFKFKIPGFSFFAFILYLVINAILSKRLNKTISNDEYLRALLPESVSQEKLNQYNFTEEQLKQELYQIFIDVQMAWMNFDYDSLQKLCSNELYNSYKSDLEVLKKKQGQNIMSDFIQGEMIITNIKEENNRIIVSVFLSVSFYDYVIDTETKNIIRGNSTFKLSNDYDLEFVKSKVKENDRCPNCGGTIIDNKCENCHSIVTNGYMKFVLDKKKIHK